MEELRRRLGQRIRVARTALSITQQELARDAALPAPQVVSQIEKGEREVKAWELVNIARVLRVDIATLLQDQEPAPRAVVLWREGPVEEREIREAEFVQACERYALLERLCGQCVASELPSWPDEPARLTFERASAMADLAREQLGLGSRPSSALQGVLEERYGVKIWCRPLGTHGSAACTRDATGPAILINADEVPWRRNFSVAHELFHLLTWERSARGRRDSGERLPERVEQVANTFASALLLPESVLRPAVERRIHEQRLGMPDIVELAREFDVSADALLWRLRNLGILSAETVESIRNSEAFRALDRSSRPAHWARPPDLPERYVRLGFTAYLKGSLSRARLAEFLGVSLADLNVKLEEYGFDERQDYAAEYRTA